MLFIAEKPELARAIVDALGGGTAKKGYIQCENDTVTWCFGHMLRLYDPHEYDPIFKKWTLDVLPMFFIPWKKMPVEKSKDQLAVIVQLLRDADTVVHAGDPDAEGQLLVDEVLQFAGYTGPVKRVLINDNNTAVVKKALSNLRDNAEFKGLSSAAEARQVADQLVGYNMTRLYTLMARNEGYPGTLNVGRVKTAIHGLVVRRDRENAGHQKVPYYAIHGIFRTGDTRFTAAYQNKEADPQDEKGRLTHFAHAQGIADGVTGKMGVVKTFKVRPGETPPPLPYNLLALQADASRMHGIAPDAVKEITQNLREKYRLITYNRSDSQYLSDEQYADAPDVIAAVFANVENFAGYARKVDPGRKSRAFDSSKVTAHHAIIPTQARVDFNALSIDEKRIYSLIARAYLAQFMAPQTWQQSTTIIESEGNTFSRTAKTIKENGWKDFYSADPRATDNEDSEDIDGTAIVFEPGQELICVAGKCERKETKPRPLYTVASLLEDLTRVAQYITNPDLRQTLIEKDKGKAGERGGIGTPATRDEILAGLLKNGLLELKKNGKVENIVSTDIGKELYDCLPNTAKYPDMTALWHQQQHEIESGDRDIGSFIDGIIAYIGQEIARVMNEGLKLNIEKHACSTCGSAMTLKKAGKKKFWGCVKYPDCKTTLPDDGGKPGTATTVTIDESVHCPQCGKAMRYVKHAKGEFFACVDYPQCKSSRKAKNGKPVESEAKPRVSEKYKCKNCGKGLVRRKGRQEGQYFWGCSDYPACATTYPDADGKPIFTTREKKEKTNGAEKEA